MGLTVYGGQSKANMAEKEISVIRRALGGEGIYIFWQRNIRGETPPHRADAESAFNVVIVINSAEQKVQRPAKRILRGANKGAGVGRWKNASA